MGLLDDPARRDRALGCWRMSQPELVELKEQVYKDPRPKEHFDRFHERTRTREPDFIYEVVRIVMSLMAWIFFRVRGMHPERVPAVGAVILAPESLLVPGPLLPRRGRCGARSTSWPSRSCSSRRCSASTRTAASSRCGAGSPTRRRSPPPSRVLDRGDTMAMYAEGGRSRTGELSSKPRRGIGRLALLSGAPVVPVAIVGSSHVRNWKRLQFPKVTVHYGEPFAFERVEAPTRDQEQATADAIFAEVRALYEAARAGSPS